MERGPLSQPDFPAFSAKVIPFLHLTTRIKGKKHDGLLGEKGFRSFPTLAFMDAEGKIIGQPAERSIASFEQAFDVLSKHLELVAKHLALEKRIANGEKGLEFELFVAEYNLGKVTGEAVTRRIKAFKDLTPAQQKQADQILLDEEVIGLIKRAMEDEDAVRTVSARFVELLDANTLPSKRVALDFWAILAHTAAKDSNAALLERVIQGLRKGYPDREDVQNYAASLEEKLKELSK